MTTVTEKRAWYLEPYVWLLIALPLSAVLGGSATMYLAIESDDGLVVDDYYKQGLEINQSLERNQAAVTYGLSGQLELKPERKVVLLSLESNAQYQLPEQIELSFLHRTQAGHDKTGILKRIANTMYQAELPELIAGNWYVQLSTPEWRMLAPVTLPYLEPILITPNS